MCRPRQRFLQLKNVPNRLLVTDDIKGSKPDAIKFKSNRDSNPLNPHYRLQTVTFVEEDARKFLRDTLEVKDITDERTLGKSLVHQPHAVRETNKVDDIAGARSRSTMINRNLGPYEAPVNPITGAIDSSPNKPILNGRVDKTQYDYLDYNDVTNFKRFQG